MNMQEMAEGQPRKKGGLLYDFEQVKYERDQLLSILREALTEVDEQIESGDWVLDPRCNECSDGSLPLKYLNRPCWVHKARKLIGEAQ